MRDDFRTVRTGPATAVAIVMLALAASVGAAGLEVEVVGGGEEVTDWVVEQALDIGTAGRLLRLGGAVDGQQIAVVEIGADGKVLATKSTQVDGGDKPEEAVVSWLIDGKLSPGQTRRFRIELGSREKTPKPVKAIEVTEDGTKCVIRN